MSNVINFQNKKDQRDIIRNNLAAIVNNQFINVKINKVILQKLVALVETMDINKRKGI